VGWGGGKKNKTVGRGGGGGGPVRYTVLSGSILSIGVGYSRINSTEFPASGAGMISEPRLTSKVRSDQPGGGFAPLLVRLRSNCEHVTEVGGA